MKDVGPRSDFFSLNRQTSGGEKRDDTARRSGHCPTANNPRSRFVIQMPCDVVSIAAGSKFSHTKPFWCSCSIASCNWRHRLTTAARRPQVAGSGPSPAARPVADSATIKAPRSTGTILIGGNAGIRTRFALGSLLIVRPNCRTNAVHAKSSVAKLNVQARFRTLWPRIQPRRTVDYVPIIQMDRKRRSVNADRRGHNFTIAVVAKLVIA